MLRQRAVVRQKIKECTFYAAKQLNSWAQSIYQKGGGGDYPCCSCGCHPHGYGGGSAGANAEANAAASSAANAGAGGGGGGYYPG